MRYRPEIDGLRAVAVIAVILFHLGVPALPGGYLGVDVFFVISGYLITSLIAPQLEAGTFSLRTFWARRIRRILPALLAMVAGTMGVLSLVVYPTNFSEFSGQGLAAILSYSNFYTLWHLGSYWGPQAEASPFLHCWSLAVEEQFYLLFPLVLVAIARWRRHWLRPLVALATVASLGVFLLGTEVSPRATFYLLPTRAWELGIGAILALGWPRPHRSPWLGHAGGTLGIMGLGFVFCFAPEAQRLGPIMIVAVLSTAVFLHAGSPGWTQRILSTGPLRYVGRISYSLYLWHWPVIVIARIIRSNGVWEPSLTAQVVAFSALSLLSYHLVEQPMRKSRGKVPLILGTQGALAVLVFALPTLLLRPMPVAFAIDSYGSNNFGLNPYAYNRRAVLKPEGPQFIPTPRGEIDAYQHEGFIISGSKPTPQLVLLGDSHGAAWGHEFELYAASRNVTTSIWVLSGAVPEFETPEHPLRWKSLPPAKRTAYDASRRTKLPQWHPKLIVIAAFDIPRRQRHGFREFLREISGYADHVLLLEEPPVSPRTGENLLNMLLTFLGYRPTADEPIYFGELPAADLAKRRQELTELCAEYPNVSFLPVTDKLTDHNRVLVGRGDKLYFLDADHMTSFGTALFTSRLATALDELLGIEQSQPAP